MAVEFEGVLKTGFTPAHGEQTLLFILLALLPEDHPRERGVDIYCNSLCQ